MNYSIFFYIVVTMAAVFAQFAQTLAKDKNNKYILNKFFYILSFMCLLVFLGFRECGVGIDDYTYMSIFNKVNENGVISVFLTTTMEPGFLLLNYIVGLFTDDFQIMMVVISFISLFFVYKALEYERKNINFFLAFFIFGTTVYSYFFGVLRLSMAVSICFYSLKFLMEKERKKFNLFVIIASTIHYSALIMFLLNFLIKKEISNKSVRNFYAYALCLFPIFFVLISKFIVPLLGSRYSSYLINRNLKITLGDFDKLPIIILCIFFYKNMKEITNKSKLYLVLYSVTVLASIYSSIVNFGRIQWYFNILICLIFPILVKGIRKTKEVYKLNIILIPLIIIYCVLFSSKIIRPDAKNVNFEIYNNVLIK